MLYDNGKNVRCGCGCNVFRKEGEKDGVLPYKCNSCGEIISGRR